MGDVRVCDARAWPFFPPPLVGGAGGGDRPIARWFQEADGGNGFSQTGALNPSPGPSHKGRGEEGRFATVFLAGTRR